MNIGKLSILNWHKKANWSFWNFEPRFGKNEQCFFFIVSCFEFRFPRKLGKART
jgi:hypothetical protein